MSVKEQYWRYSLVVIILGLGTIIFVKLLPFLGGLLGALTIYILVRKQMFSLTENATYGAVWPQPSYCANRSSVS